MKLSTAAGVALLCLVGLVCAAQATVFFKEDFSGDWDSRWVVSDWKKDSGTQGKFDVTAAQWVGDAEINKGLHTSQDARFYTIAAPVDQEFSNKDKDLIVQFSVMHPQKIDCGGGYVKLLPKSVDLKEFTGDSEYNIMFGPDMCGAGKKITHLILNYKGTNHLIKKEIPAADNDQLTHVYTLILRPDQTYEVRIDGQTKQTGSLLDDWSFLAPKTIKDPEVSKPVDWVDIPMIDDPEDTKPEDWDTEPEKIPDPEAEKPEDWDDEEDGEWEAPMVHNPEFKGTWSPKKISNPEYKGPWKHPEIPNPEYEEDKEIYAFESFAAVGIDVWQVKSGTIFDNFILTDDLAEAEAFMAETWGATKDAEKEAFEAVQAEKRAADEAERKRMEEERAANAAASNDEDEYEEDDEEEEEAKESHGHDHEDL